MNSIVITGCNRGLGLGLVKQLVKEINPPKYIIATCRNIDGAKELQELAVSNKNIHLLQLDVKNLDTFPVFSDQVESIVRENGLNVLFNNAGYSPRSTKINVLKAEDLINTLAVNTVGPVMLTKALLPLLKRAADANINKPLGNQRAAVVNMSSILGSITLNKEGGLYPYRCSKAALNMATKSLSLDVKQHGILVTCVHPGWVKTDMGGKNAPMEVDSSCSSLVNFLANLSEKHNGGYFQWDGKPLEW